MQREISITATVSPTLTPEIINTGIITLREALVQMFGKDKTPSADGAKILITAQNGLNYWEEINTLVCFWGLTSEECKVITGWVD